MKILRFALAVALFAALVPTIALASLEDDYAALGVTPENSNEEVRAAFWALARRYHPDMQSSEADEEKFKTISNAYASVARARNGRGQSSADAAPGEDSEYAMWWVMTKGTHFEARSPISVEDMLGRTSLYGRFLAFVAMMTEADQFMRQRPFAPRSRGFWRDRGNAIRQFGGLFQTVGALGLAGPLLTPDPAIWAAYPLVLGSIELRAWEIRRLNARPALEEARRLTWTASNSVPVGANPASAAIFAYDLFDIALSSSVLDRDSRGIGDWMERLSPQAPRLYQGWLLHSLLPSFAERGDLQDLRRRVRSSPRAWRARLAEVAQLPGLPPGTLARIAAAVGLPVPASDVPPDSGGSDGPIETSPTLLTGPACEAFR